MSFRYELSQFIPYRDVAECERVRAIKKEDITRHPNPDFRIRVIEEADMFYFTFAMDIVKRVVESRDRGEKCVLILPVGPVPQFTYVSDIVNTLGIPMDHVHTFNMDEYADEEGNTAPLNWPGSFQKAMWENFFSRIEPKLRPHEHNIHFPNRELLPDYGKMIEDVGGADCCYGGVGWCAHIAFWEAHLGFEFGDDLEAFKQAGPRLVELHPMTIMQNALHSFSGDWSWVPPKANTIGPAQIVGSKDRSFWLDGYLGGGVSWQRFIARLAAHGKVNTLVPASILQTLPGTYTILGGVADNVEVQMA